MFNWKTPNDLPRLPPSPCPPQPPREERAAGRRTPYKRTLPPRGGTAEEQRTKPLYPDKARSLTHPHPRETYRLRVALRLG